MKRIVNTTGTCIPGRHFTADVSGKIDRLMEMIDRGDYFTINRLRQFGKTTLMYLLFHEMKKNKNYLPLDISFEGLGSSTYTGAYTFIPAFLDLLSMRLEFTEETEAAALIKKNADIREFNKLSRFITEFVRQSGRNVV